MSRGGGDVLGNDPGVAQLRRLALQFLVHSFMYYRLGESVISDETFDRIAKDLQRLRKAFSKAEIPHAKLVDSALGPEGTAFQIRTYPPDVVTAAFKLLYGQLAPDVDFVEFVERRGYRTRLAHLADAASTRPNKTAAPGKVKKGR